MAMDKNLSRIEAKLDAVLRALKVKPEDVEAAKTAPAAPPRVLTAAEQQAIDNAPKPTPVVGPRGSTPPPPATPPPTPPPAPSLPRQPSRSKDDTSASSVRSD